jgi:hypothetical protein
MPPAPGPWIALYSLHYHGEWHRYGLVAPQALDSRFVPFALFDIGWSLNNLEESLVQDF